MKKMLLILADDIATMTGLNPTVCRGMLRIVAEDNCGSNDPLAISNYIERMDYFAWERMLGDKAFHTRLKNVGIQDVNTVVNKAKRTLIEKQSLFTMGIN